MIQAAESRPPNLAHGFLHIIQYFFIRPKSELFDSLAVFPHPTLEVLLESWIRAETCMELRAYPFNKFLPHPIFTLGLDLSQPIVKSGELNKDSPKHAFLFSDAEDQGRGDDRASIA